MIDFTRALSSAWERTVIILLRPFDLEKWAWIGFGAFLALMAEGGVSLNNPIPLPGKQVNPPAHLQSFPQIIHTLAQQYMGLLHPHMTFFWALYLSVGLMLWVVWMALNWVGSRGEFVFLDNIVRNRAALAEPWHRYARQGNIWFVFHSALLLLTYAMMAAAGVGLLVLNWGWISTERTPGKAEMAGILIYSGGIMAAFVAYCVVVFLIQSIALPLYFKQQMGLLRSLGEIGRLLVTQPVNMILFILANFILGIVTLFIAVPLVIVACCMTIGISCIPLIGPVILAVVLCQLMLPILVFTRCFQLQCLADMGPEYDVWTVDVPPGGPAVPPGFNPLRPRG